MSKESNEFVARMFPVFEDFYTSMLSQLSGDLDYADRESIDDLVEELGRIATSPMTQAAIGQRLIETVFTLCSDQLVGRAKSGRDKVEGFVEEATNE